MKFVLMFLDIGWEERPVKVSSMGAMLWESTCLRVTRSHR